MFTNTGETQALEVTSWDESYVLPVLDPLMLEDNDYNDELEACHAVPGPQTSVLVRREFDLTNLATNVLLRDGDGSEPPAPVMKEAPKPKRKISAEGIKRICRLFWQHTLPYPHNA